MPMVLLSATSLGSLLEGSLSLMVLIILRLLHRWGRWRRSIFLSLLRPSLSGLSFSLTSRINSSRRLDRGGVYAASPWIFSWTIWHCLPTTQVPLWPQAVAADVVWSFLLCHEDRRVSPHQWRFVSFISPQSVWCLHSCGLC